MGYDSTNIFRVWLPNKQKVISARSVTFNEMERYQPGEPREDKQSSQEIDQLVESIQILTLPTIELATDLDTDEKYTEYSSLDPSMTPDTSSKSTTVPGLPILQETPKLQLQQLIV